MLNNINGKGLSKSKKVDILNIPGATSDDIVDQVDDVVETGINIVNLTMSISSITLKKLLIKPKTPPRIPP